MIEHLFPTPVGIYELGRNITNEELDYIKSQSRRANMFNETSSSNYILNDCKELKSIKEFIENSLNEYVSETLSTPKDISTYITQSWSNYTEAGQNHHKHRHYNSIISGVFYIQVVEQRDNVVFHKPGVDEMPLKIVPKVDNIFNSKAWEYIITTGQLYLFPSYLSHGVPEVGAGMRGKMPTAKDQDGNYIQGSTRISLSFNTWCEGLIGMHNNLDALVLEKAIIMNKLYCLAGLPRSGTTLLGAILNQNPKVYVTTTSPFVEILWRNFSVWQDENELSCLDTLKIRDLKKPFLKNVGHSYFDELTDKEIVIDKRRAWHKISNMSMYSEIYDVKPKVICTVRDVAEIVASFMQIFEENEETFIHGETLKGSVFEDLHAWLDDSFHSTTRLMKQDLWFSDCIHLVEYNDLIDNTAKTLNEIYEFLELEPFEHDLKNIEVAEQEGNHGWKNLHTIRGNLTKSNVPLTKYLTEHEIAQYNNKNFWRKNG